MKTGIIVLVLLSLFSGMTQRPQLTGKELLDKMNSKSNSDETYVVGFVAAIYAAHKGIFLSPKDEALKEIIKGAKDFLQANPKKLSQAAAGLLQDFFDKPASPALIKK